jgi:DNA-binding transcriptional MerR regulator/effector-binding domain-containing protein
MFRIGEFAQIAQVSARQLRHYDHLGLLRPEQTNHRSGYRYYSIRQLPQLNRILALMELGLTLEQIGPLLRDEISSSQLRGMLTMKRAQLEQSLKEEEARLRHVESRIEQIDQQGKIKDYDIVVKEVEQTPYLSTRCLCDGMDDAIRLLYLISREGLRQIHAGLRDRLIVVARNDLEDAQLDLDIGFSLKEFRNLKVDVTGTSALSLSTLPAVETMATLVRSGPAYESHKALGAIGNWMEANRYEVAGPCREVFLEPLTDPPANQDGVLVEIQFPVRQAA